MSNFFLEKTEEILTPAEALKKFRHNPDFFNQVIEAKPIKEDWGQIRFAGFKLVTVLPSRTVSSYRTPGSTLSIRRSKGWNLDGGGSPLALTFGVAFEPQVSVFGISVGRSNHLPLVVWPMEDEQVFVGHVTYHDFDTMDVNADAVFSSWSTMKLDEFMKVIGC